MREIKTFSTDDPTTLSTQLSKLEDNVIQQFADDEAAASPIPMVGVANGAYLVGQVVKVNTFLAPLAVNVSPASAAKRPGFLTFIVTNNALTLRPTTGLINLAATWPINAGVSQVYFDGTDWWTPA